MSWGDEEDYLEDLVILGRAAPEEMSDGRQNVCTGAWSPERGFIRLYPISPQDNLFSRWDIVDAEVERNPDDKRHESWKIKGRKRHQTEKVDIVGEYPRDKRATLIHNLADDCVSDINEEDRSLGIISPEKIHDLEYIDWETDDAPGKQAKLFEEIDDSRPDNREDFAQNIKLRYTCDDCSTQQGYHNQTLLSWEAYMGMKNTESSDQLWSNFQFSNDDYRHWLFVGNMNLYKNSYIVISVLRLKNPTINQTLKKFRKKDPDFKPAYAH